MVRWFYQPARENLMTTYRCNSCFLDLPTAWSDGDECPSCFSVEGGTRIETMIRKSVILEDNHDYVVYNDLYGNDLVPADNYDADVQLHDGPYTFNADDFKFSRYAKRTGNDDYLRDHDLMLPVLQILSMAGRALATQEVMGRLIDTGIVPNHARAVMEQRLGWTMYYLRNSSLIAYRGENVYGCTENGLVLADMNEADARAKLKVVYDRLHFWRESREVA